MCDATPRSCFWSMRGAAANIEAVSGSWPWKGSITAAGTTWRPSKTRHYDSLHKILHHKKKWINGNSSFHAGLDSPAQYLWSCHGCRDSDDLLSVPHCRWVLILATSGPSRHVSTPSYSLGPYVIYDKTDLVQIPPSLLITALLFCFFYTVKELTCLLCRVNNMRCLGRGLSDCSDGGRSTSGTRTAGVLGCVGALKTWEMTFKDSEYKHISMSTESNDAVTLKSGWLSRPTWYWSHVADSAVVVEGASWRLQNKHNIIVLPAHLEPIWESKQHQRNNFHIPEVQSCSIQPAGRSQWSDSSWSSMWRVAASIYWSG